MKDLILSEIWIYPVKSLGGIRLKSAKVMHKGLQYDRRWMLVDEQGGFMTQRVYPEMALFKLDLDAGRNEMMITKKNATADPTIKFNINTDQSGKTFRAKIWNDEVDVIEVSPELSEWFRFHLKMYCKFVAFPESNPRPVDPVYKVNDEHVGLADAYPFMIIGQSSLDDLNNKLDVPVPMNRFRPNFVFTGGDPYEEDTWRNFAIGKNRFVGVKLCARCVLTTVNQDTAEKGIEPLRTLSTYRKREAKVLFGQNLVALDYTEVQEGNKITVY